jgi:hypothetical protein
LRCGAWTGPTSLWCRGILRVPKTPTRGGFQGHTTALLSCNAVGRVCRHRCAASAATTATFSTCCPVLCSTSTLHRRTWTSCWTRTHCVPCGGDLMRDRAGFGYLSSAARDHVSGWRTLVPPLLRGRETGLVAGWRQCTVCPAHAVTPGTLPPIRHDASRWSAVAQLPGGHEDVLAR